MLEKVTNFITKKMFHAKVIEEEDLELYQYGIRNGIMMLVNWMGMIIAGICFGDVLEMLAFAVAYFFLRSYAGGLHMSTHKRCFLFSVPVYLLCAWGICNMSISFYCLIGILLVAIVVLLVIAPVEDENKPLDTVEKTVYKKMTMGIVMILSIGAVFLYQVQMYSYASSIIWAVSLTAIFALVGEIGNRK